LLPQDLVRKNGIHCLKDNELDALKALLSKEFVRLKDNQLNALNKLFKVVSPGIEGCLDLCAKNFSVFFMRENSRRERNELLNIEGQKVEVPGLADFSRGIAEFNLQSLAQEIKVENQRREGLQKQLREEIEILNRWAKRKPLSLEEIKAKVKLIQESKASSSQAEEIAIVSPVVSTNLIKDSGTSQDKKIPIVSPPNSTILTSPSSSSESPSPKELLRVLLSRITSQTGLKLTEAAGLLFKKVAYPSLLSYPERRLIARLWPLIQEIYPDEIGLLKRNQLVLDSKNKLINILPHSQSQQSNTAKNFVEDLLESADMRQIHFGRTLKLTTAHDFEILLNRQELLLDGFRNRQTGNSRMHKETSDRLNYYAGENVDFSIKNRIIYILDLEVQFSELLERHEIDGEDTLFKLVPRPVEQFKQAWGRSDVQTAQSWIGANLLKLVASPSNSTETELLSLMPPHVAKYFTDDERFENLLKINLDYVQNCLKGAQVQGTKGFVST
jgi:hypothetical protein